MYCTNCGKETLDNSIFCAGCGAKIIEEKPIKIERSVQGKIKRIIYIALYVLLVLAIFDALMTLFSSTPQSALSGFFWAAICAYFIERIKRGKIGKVGWVLAGIITGIVIIILLSTLTILLVPLF